MTSLFLLDSSKRSIKNEKELTDQTIASDKSYLNMHSMYSATVSSIEEALGKPTISEKCTALTQALRTSSLKDLHSQFPLLVQKIFGFQRFAPGWLVQQLHKTQQKKDYEAVVAFLSPDGPLFTIINKLLYEDVSYEYPMHLLPEATTRKFNEGTLMSELYANKINIAGAPCVLLNAFEYYFFVFSHKMVDSTTKTQSLYLEPSDWCYPNLLNVYLMHFLPLNGMPISLPCATVPVSQPTSVAPHRSVSSPQSPIKKHSLGLLKHTPSLQRSLSVQNNVMDPIHLDALWRTEKLVQILVEFWLNQTSIDFSSTKSYSPINSSKEFLPSHDLIMVVRMLIKHLHVFCNTSDGGLLVSHQQNLVTSLGAVKRTLLQKFVQRPLYGFLKHSFEKWPLDTSFRPILETWLTFIRPWKYSNMNDGTEQDQQQEVNFYLWKPFVLNYSLFYTSLLQEVINRFVRVDLRSSKMAFQLSRVTKVFATAGLTDILRDIDDSISVKAPYHDYGYGDVTEGAVSGLQAILASQINEMESTSYQYKPFYSEEALHQAHYLLKQLVEAHYAVTRLLQNRKQSVKSSTRGDNSLLRVLGLGDMIDFNTSQSIDEKRDENLQTEKWLQQCITELATVFKFQVPELCTVEKTTDDDIDRTVLPDHITTDCGIQLTEKGRYQIINGLRRFPIEYRGDPELQPIRSYENASLVRMLYQLTYSLNKKYGEQFKDLYYRDDFFGLIAQRYLVAPHTTSAQCSPRLSLRVLANYNFIFCAVLLYLILWALFGKVSSLLFMLLIVVLYGLFGALCNKLSSQFTKSKQS